MFRACALLPANAGKEESSGDDPFRRILFAIARPPLLSYFIRLLPVYFARLRAQLENRRIFVIFQFNSFAVPSSLKFDPSNDSFVANEISKPLKINPRAFVSIGKRNSGKTDIFTVWENVYGRNGETRSDSCFDSKLQRINRVEITETIHNVLETRRCTYE